MIVTEVKRFDANQPRDSKGRWVETGAELRNNLSGAIGTVLKGISGGALGEDRFRVRLADGSTSTWDSSAVTAVRNRDGSTPTVAKPGTAEARAEQSGGTGTPQVAGETATGTPATSRVRASIEAVYAKPGAAGGRERADRASGAREAIGSVNESSDRPSPETDAARARVNGVREGIASLFQGTGPAAAPDAEAQPDAPVTPAVTAGPGPVAPDATPAAAPPQAASGIYPMGSVPAPSTPDVLRTPDNLYMVRTEWLWLATQLETGGVATDRSKRLRQMAEEAPDSSLAFSQDGALVIWSGTDKVYDAKSGIELTPQIEFANDTHRAAFLDALTASGLDFHANAMSKWSDPKVKKKAKAAVLAAMSLDPETFSPPQPAPDAPPAPDSPPPPPAGSKDWDAALTDLVADTHATPPGITEEHQAVLTEAQQIAIKQKWKLPTGTVAELTAERDAVTQATTPTALELIDGGMHPEQAAKEAKRLARNAQVGAWRARTKLQAAIDAQVAKDKEQGPSAGLSPVDQVKLDAVSPKNELVLLDMALDRAAGKPPLIIYDSTGDAALKGDDGPGGVLGGQWATVVAKLDDNGPPVPVAGVTVHGHKVTAGWAQKINGRSYLVEAKDGESAEAAAMRMHDAAAMTDTVLKEVPGDWAKLQRGVALLNSPNPQDTHWASLYGKGFVSDATGGDGTTTFWNGTAATPGTIAHEFGHTFDAKSQDLDQPISAAGDSWSQASTRDSAISKFYADGRFIETRKGEPIVIGQGGVTNYGGLSPQEDFAESVRLYIKDRRESKIGYDPKTGDNIRFADLFPERARLLDKAFGVESNYDTAANKRRVKEAYDSAYVDLLNAASMDLPPFYKAPNFDPEQWSAQHGLSYTQGGETFLRAAEAAAKKAKQDKEAAAAIAAAKAAHEAAKAAAAVKTFEDALAAGLITKPELTKLTGRRRARAYHLRQKGYSKEDAQAEALAWEQAYLAEHYGAANVGAYSPWVGKAIEPGTKEKERRAAKKLLDDAGSTVHPYAANQGVGAKAQQAKANIAAEIASRLNNPEDWALFQEYRGAYTYEFDSYSPQKRQEMLANEVSTRIQKWAGTSGDSDAAAVMMQMAAAEEFGLDAHPAPTVSDAQYEQIKSQYTAAKAMFYRAFLRHQYEHTQEQFAAAGITHISVFRGMRFNFGSVPDWAVADGTAKRPKLQPLNSWSTQRSVSKNFAGSSSGAVMFEARVPVELVIGSAATGFGCLNEFEYVLLDSEGTALATKP